MMVKVLYIASPTSSFAGIERVLDEICTELAQAYNHVISVDLLFTCTFKHEQLINRHYKKIQIDTKGNIFRFLSTVRSVVLKGNYDIVIVPQVEGTVFCWMASLGSKARFVAYLHGNPYRERSHWKAHVLFFLMRTVVLKRLAAVFGTSPKQLAAFQRMMGEADTPCTWVPNPTRKFQESEFKALHHEHNGVTLVNVGRFSYQKGQDILIKAFASALRHRPNLKLCMVGYGQDEEALKRLAHDLGLNDSVEFAHYPVNPAPALAAADIFVSSSRWEGWSLAICEALRFGLPIISTDCDFGPSDILIDNRLGVLVPVDDVDAMANAIVDYADRLTELRSFAEYRKSYIQRFDIERVTRIHADALIAVSNPTAKPPALLERLKEVQH